MTEVNIYHLVGSTCTNCWVGLGSDQMRLYHSLAGSGGKHDMYDSLIPGSMAKPLSAAKPTTSTGHEECFLLRKIHRMEEISWETTAMMPR